MWCKRCQQDVPGVLSAKTGGYSCPRCEEPLVIEGSAKPAAPAGPAKPIALVESAHPDAGLLGPHAPPNYDPWETEEHIRHIGRMLSAETPPNEPPPRLDTPHTEPVAPSPPPADTAPAHPAHPANHGAAGQGLLGLVTWATWFLGTSLFICGATLAVWSILGARPDLRRVGLPITAGGTIALAMGILLQLDSWWRSRRRTLTLAGHGDIRHDQEAGSRRRRRTR
jgi:hypothetical protein